MKQSNTKIIGLTGGIASGKSTASNIINKLGFKVIDADKIARDVQEIGKPAYREIVDYFGEEIVDIYGNINRKALGNVVFNNDSEREKLNRIVHPYIFKAIKESIDRNSDKKILFVDIPLLIEQVDNLNKHKIEFDEIWLVYVDEKTQITRLMERDSIDKEEALKKIRAQMPIELKKNYATRIIDNRGDIETLEEQIRQKIKDVI